MSTNTETVINFDRPKLEEFKLALAYALANRQDQFMFAGVAFVTTYAKYLAEFMDNELGWPQN